MDLTKKIHDRIEKLQYRKKLAKANNDLSVINDCTSRIDELTQLVGESKDIPAPPPEKNDSEKERPAGFTSADQTVKQATDYLDGKTKAELDGWLDADESRKTILKLWEELPDA